jgi:hypothetical protein
LTLKSCKLPGRMPGGSGARSCAIGGGGGGGGAEAACCLVVQAPTISAADKTANLKTVEILIYYLPKTKAGAGLPQIRMHPLGKRFNRQKEPKK